MVAASASGPCVCGVPPFPSCIGPFEGPEVTIKFKFAGLAFMIKFCMLRADFRNNVNGSQHSLHPLAH